MNNLRSKLSNLKNACHIFRPSPRGAPPAQPGPPPATAPQAGLASGRELKKQKSKSDICPLAKAGQPFEVARGEYLRRVQILLPYPL